MILMAMLCRSLLIATLTFSSLTASAELRVVTHAKLLCQSLLTKMRIGKAVPEEKQVPVPAPIAPKVLSVFPKPVQPKNKNVKFDDLESLMRAFAQGLLPDLTQPDQLNAFDAYMKMYFGINSQHIPSADSYSTITKQLAANPDLWNQPRFRNMEIALVHRKLEPISPELKATTERLLRTARATSSQLFQVLANVGQWRKILQLDKDIAIETIVPADLLLQLSDEKVAGVHKCKILAEYFIRERQSMIEAGRNVRPIGQAIADLIHARAFLEKQVEIDLISADTHVRIGAFKSILQIRDSFAMELGFEGHYSEVLSKMQVPSPKGLQNPREINSYIKKFENEAYVAEVDASNATRVLVRHLSLLEKPQRSCLGGSDCSSRTYFDFALGLAPQYFTLTYPNGISSGHMTVILGRFDNENQPPNAAFLDKVQNVPIEALLPMLEAIRQSLAEQGVELYAPKKLDEHTDGLTNDDFIQVAMQKIVNQLTSEPKQGFKAAIGDYSVSHGYSRAFGRVKDMYAFHSPKDHAVNIEPRIIDLPWKTSDVNFSKSIREAIGLRDGTTVEKLKYLAMYKLMLDMKLDTPEDLINRIFSWLADSTTPLRFRTDILIYLSQSHDMQNLKTGFVRQALAITKNYPLEDRLNLFNRLVAKQIFNQDSKITYWADNEQVLQQQFGMWSFNQILVNDVSDLIKQFPEGHIQAAFKKTVEELSVGFPDSLREKWLKAAGQRSLLDETEEWINTTLVSGEKSEIVDVIEDIWARTKQGRIVHGLISRLLNNKNSFDRIMKNEELANAYRDFSDFLNRPRSGCFVAGTPIITPQGSIPIEQIQVGQVITAFDPSSGRITTDRVSQLHRTEELRRVETLEFSNGQTLTSTPEHPFYSVDRGDYVIAAELNLGEEVYVLKDGQLSAVRLMDRTRNEALQRIYNFEAERFHNYFSNGILVHNKIHMGI